MPRGGLESVAAGSTGPRRLFHGADGGGGGGVGAGPVMRDGCPGQGWPSRQVRLRRRAFKFLSCHKNE